MFRIVSLRKFTLAITGTDLSAFILFPVKIKDFDSLLWG